MGTAAIKIKLMPESPSSDIKQIEEAAEKTITLDGGWSISFSEEPIAFGLKAIYASFAWPEEKDLDQLENKLGQLKEVKSAEISDMRRAIG